MQKLAEVWIFLMMRAGNASIAVKPRFIDEIAMHQLQLNLVS